MNSQYQQIMAEFVQRTQNQPAQNVSFETVGTILRNGADAEGNRVVDKYCNGPVCNCTVELPDGQWRVYNIKWPN